MDINLFDYKLPEKLIAQFPSRKRDQSRLMVLDRNSGEIEIHPFKHIVKYINSGDVLVVNNTKVFKARLLGHRSTGAEVEIFLVRKISSDNSEIWEALARPSRRLKTGEGILFPNYSVKLIEQLGDGRWRVEFKSKFQGRKLSQGLGMCLFRSTSNGMMSPPIFVVIKRSLLIHLKPGQ